MASDTLHAPSLSTADTSGMPAKPTVDFGTPSVLSGPVLSKAAEPGLPKTLYVITVDFDADEPQLSPAPAEGQKKSSQNGYQFPGDRQDAALLFVIADRARAEYSFTGFDLEPVETSTPVKKRFPMPVVRGSYMSPSMLLVELYFTQKSADPQEASLNLTFLGPNGRIIHDPQVGNDGGNAAPPPPMPKYDSHGA